MSSQLAPLSQTWNLPFTASPMALLTPPHLAVQAPPKSPMVLQEVNPSHCYPSLSPIFFEALPFSLTLCSPQGDGSYANPETFATALNNPNFVPCEIIYLPLLQKYFQYMDHCEECMTLYPTTTRIDLWIGTDVNGGQNQIDCEDAFGLKTGQTIIRDPPSTLKVNGGQLWDNDSGTCNDDTMVFPNYSTSEADMCAGGSTSASGESSGASPAPSSTSSTYTPPASTSSTPPAHGTPLSTESYSTSPSKEKVNPVPQVDIVADVADVKPKAPSPTTMATPSPSPSSVPSGSASSSNDCGISAEWPTAWLGHCVGTPCHEFNDCSGELICQGWPNPVCTDPKSGK